jgi:hypothetical protein
VATSKRIAISVSSLPSSLAGPLVIIDARRAITEMTDTPPWRNGPESKRFAPR